MNLQDFAKPLMAKNHFVKASFGGFAGSGKTKTASDFIIGCYKDMQIKKPLLIIDNEKGSRFLIPKFKTAGIETLLKETTELADIIQAMDFLNKGDIGFLFVDSLSKVWYKYVKDYLQKNRKTFMQLDDWGKLLPAWQSEFSDRFVDVSGSFVFTGRGGFQYEKEEDTERSDGSIKKGAFVKSGVKMKLAGETPFEPDLNIWMEVEQELKKDKLIVYRTAQVMKDRNDSKTSIDGKLFRNPTYKDFQPFINFLLNNPIGQVIGSTNDSNLAPSEDFGWQERKKAREIELEKIKAEFDKVGFGSTKEEKQMKTLVIERCFGTTSMTEIEKKDVETLALLRESLQKFFNKFSTYKIDAENGDVTKTPIQFVQEYDFTIDSEMPDFLQQTKKG